MCMLRIEGEESKGCAVSDRRESERMSRVAVVVTVSRHAANYDHSFNFTHLHLSRACDGSLRLCREVERTQTWGDSILMTLCLAPHLGHFLTGECLRRLPRAIVPHSFSLINAYKVWCSTEAACQNGSRNKELLIRNFVNIRRHIW